MNGKEDMEYTVTFSYVEENAKQRGQVKKNMLQDKTAYDKEAALYEVNEV